MDKGARNCVRVRSVRIVTLRFVDDDDDEIAVGGDEALVKRKKVDPTVLNDNGVNIFAGPCDLPYSSVYCPFHATIDKTISPEDIRTVRGTSPIRIRRWIKLFIVFII